MAQLGYFPVQELNNEFALTAITVDYDDRPVASGESAYKRYSSSASPRTRVPWRHQNHPEALHQSIIKSWQAAEPDEKRKGEIERIMQKLTHTINNSTSYIDNPGRNRYKVDAFGSMAWGGDTGKSGDLDLVVLVGEVSFRY